MGHLYYDELGNSAGGPLSNTGDFGNLNASWYWSSTESANSKYIWGFNMATGQQGTLNRYNGYYALAVRSGHVSSVPIPGAIWLLGSGLMGMVALGRLKKGNRV